MIEDPQAELRLLTWAAHEPVQRADGYDARAASRDGAADERDRRADSRDAVADLRDVAANRRDQVLAELLRAADRRDLAAEKRDALARHRDDEAAIRQLFEPSVKADERDRHHSAIDRMWSGNNRDAAAVDRCTLAEFLRDAASLREAAVKDQDVAGDGEAAVRM
jgi:hypothetical protein